tara:strand:- start:1162 stop:1446 length:285 start_codon:yes stop_codon:yes gene_type:complete
MKGYWIVKVNVLDLEKQKEYATLATEAVNKYQGQFLVRGGKQSTKEGKEYERNVVVEFPSYEQAQSAYESEEYQSAKKILGDNKDRIFQIVEGV